MTGAGSFIGRWTVVVFCTAGATGASIGSETGEYNLTSAPPRPGVGGKEISSGKRIQSL